MIDTRAYPSDLVVAAAHILKGLGHDGFERMLLEMNLPDRGAGRGKTLMARANSLARYAIDNPAQRTVAGQQVGVEIVARAVDLLAGDRAFSNVSKPERETLIGLMKRDGVDGGVLAGALARLGGATAGTAILDMADTPLPLRAAFMGGNEVRSVNGGDKKPAPEPVRQVAVDVPGSIEWTAQVDTAAQTPIETGNAPPGSDAQRAPPDSAPVFEMGAFQAGAFQGAGATGAAGDISGRPDVFPPGAEAVGTTGNLAGRAAETSSGRATLTVRPAEAEILRRVDEFETAVRDLKPIVEAVNQAVRETQRLGMGGNNPPEPIDPPPLDGEMLDDCALAGAAIRDIVLVGEKVSVPSIELSRRTLQRAEPRVDAFAEWLARKGDLFIDEFVKQLGKRAADIPALIATVKVLGLTIGALLAVLGMLLASVPH
jgi:hypothetical protein